MRFDPLQLLLLALFAYCWMSTMTAVFPVEAGQKWAWVWKALLWSMFLPLVMTTRLRIEAVATTMVVSAAALALSGGLKTLMGGSGYGSLQLLVDDNSGLFEGSIFSTVAIAIIPLALWIGKYGTIFAPGRITRWASWFLVAMCMLIPVGTQARTGLLCIILLVALGLRDSQKRMAYIGGIAAVALIALPLVPAAFSARMDTITNYKSDESASTRVAVWKWTWGYVLDHPMGGGFDVYRQNELQVTRVVRTGSGPTATIEYQPYTDKGRAFHNSYFEMLGEQGFPGLALWLWLQIACIIRMERLRRRYKNCQPGEEWVRPLATALQGGHLVYLLGCMFVGIAFQPFVYMLIALQMALWTYLHRKDQETGWRPAGGTPARPAAGWARG
jgi:probable O-glycosylation ligase (exosortase A-associated)